MNSYKLLATSLFALFLSACDGEEQVQPVPPLSVKVTDRAILEVEDYAESRNTALLEWVLVELNDDYGAATRLVARDAASWSKDNLPSLSYEINFDTVGEYQLSLRARQDSAYFSAQPVKLTFGADDGDVVWDVSGFDDQWSWYNNDIHGLPLRITVSTPGVHQFRIASDAEGLILDKLEISTVKDNGNSPAESDEEQQPPADDNPESSENVEDSAPDTTPSETVEQPPVNLAPEATITAHHTAAAGIPLGLAVTAEDDGLPHGGIYYYWTVTAGPGRPGFSAIQTPVTSITFVQPGTYTVQATVSDGQLYSNVSHTITVTMPPESDPNSNSEPPTEESETEEESNETNPASAGNLPGSLRWHQLTTRGKVSARHETGGVVVNGKLYVIGGRGNRPVDMFDPRNNSWTRVGNAPMEMHHFQPVAVGRKIYVIGAFTCCYPREDVIENIYIFDTVSRRWSKGPKMPKNRQRGSTGAVVYNGKIYLVGGNTRGHAGGAVNWFDEFDPQTGRWKTLANAPDARDHVTIAVVNAKLVVAGGRKTNTPVPFANTVKRTNVYDFRTGKWSTAANIPTQRAGTMTVAMGDEVIVIGGESMATKNAHRNVEAFNVNTGRWRSLASLKTARHGGAAGVLNGRIHVVTGNVVRGGGRETTHHEVLR